MRKVGERTGSRYLLAGAARLQSEGDLHLEGIMLVIGGTRQQIPSTGCLRRRVRCAGSGSALGSAVMAIGVVSHMLILRIKWATTVMIDYL